MSGVVLKHAGAAVSQIYVFLQMSSVVLKHAGAAAVRRKAASEYCNRGSGWRAQPGWWQQQTKAIQIKISAWHVGVCDGVQCAP
jgi:hypothetical protein